MTIQADSRSAEVHTPAPDGLSRARLGPEVAATILALSSVAIGGLLAIPAYGIFLGWAAASLARGARVATPVLARSLVVGGVLAAGSLLLQAPIAALFGSGIPAWVSSVAALAVVNPLLILLGRHPAFDAVPAMFIGFSTFLAIRLGSAAAFTDSILGALLVAAGTNLVGTGVHWMYGRLTGASPRRRLARTGRRRA